MKLRLPVASQKISRRLTSSRSGYTRIRPVKSTEKDQDELNAAETKSSPEFDPLDPAMTVQWGGNLPSSRRVVLGSLAGLTVALGGDLGGCTELLLANFPELGKSSGLDIIYPVRGFKRCYDTVNGYEYMYPGSWIADTVLARVNAKRAELARSVDPLTADQEAYMRRIKQGVGKVAPQTGFKPPVPRGGENISVIAAPIMAGFTLESMGSPTDAANFLLDTYVAKGKDHELLGAGKYADELGHSYYWFEYTVETPQWKRRSVAVFTSDNDVVYTLVAQCPQEVWEEDKESLRRAAFSLRLLGTQGKSGSNWDEMFGSVDRLPKGLPN